MYTQKIFSMVLCSMVASMFMVNAQIAYAQGQPEVQRGSIKLMEPLGGSDTITFSGGFEAWENYFASAAPWLYRVAVGICVLWILIGGLYIISAGDSPEGVQTGQGYIISSIIGLLVLTFAPTILRTLNNMFYT